MEALLEERTRSRFVTTKRVEEEVGGSSIFSILPEYWFRRLEEIPFKVSIQEGVSGSTVFTKELVSTIETEKDEYDIGSYNDDYDIVADVPFKNTLKIKVKINSITRLRPQVIIDFDELDINF